MFDERMLYRKLEPHESLRAGDVLFDDQVVRELSLSFSAVKVGYKATLNRPCRLVPGKPGWRWLDAGERTFSAYDRGTEGLPVCNSMTEVDSPTDRGGIMRPLTKTILLDENGKVRECTAVDLGWHEDFANVVAGHGYELLLHGESYVHGDEWISSQGAWLKCTGGGRVRIGLHVPWRRKVKSESLLCGNADHINREDFIIRDVPMGKTRLERIALGQEKDPYPASRDKGVLQETLERSHREFMKSLEGPVMYGPILHPDADDL